VAGEKEEKAQIKWSITIMRITRYEAKDSGEDYEDNDPDAIATGGSVA
jgi:hypothetical protein